MSLIGPSVHLPMEDTIGPTVGTTTDEIAGSTLPIEYLGTPAIYR